MKLLGIDFGRKRIGIAVTDELGRSVRGLATLDRHKNPDSAGALAKIIAEHQPEKLVFGLPLGPNDEDTATSLLVRSFAKRISHDCKIEVAFVDESFTSHEAENVLRSRKKKQRRDKSAVDRIAACLILQHYQQEKESGY